MANVTLIALGVGGVALLALSAGKSKTPLYNKGNPIQTIQGMPSGGASTPQAYYASVSKLQGWGEQVHTPPNPLTLSVWKAQAAEFGARWNKALTYISQNPSAPEAAKDGTGFGPSPDRFSKQSFLVYRPGHFVAGAFNEQPWGWYLTDEFGRPYEGWGYGGSAFGQVLQLAQMALPLVPGIGTAAAFSLGAAIAVGQGKSLKDAALAGARASLPPYAQIAFDIGVGVANGQSVDKAALSSGLNALEAKYPGSKDAYNKGSKLAKGLG